MEVFGGILLIGALILFFVQRQHKRQVDSILSARAMTAADLTATAGAIADEIGGGSWRDYVKLWGDVVTDTSLYSPHKQEPCVYYDAKVIREYETTVTTRDQDGKVKTERQRCTEVVTHQRQGIPFWLRDRTGRVKVDPDGAKIDTIQVLNEFRPEPTGDTLGYRYTESVLPVGRSVLVVGAVSDLTGEVVLGQPLQSQHAYLISLKTEEALTAATRRTATVLFYSMIACGVLGVGLLLGGWLS